MTPHHEFRVAPAPLPSGGAPGWVRWVATSNPFYVLSAGLFLAGLWLSFGDQDGPGQTWALMGGLAGYTLLLAVTAYLLVRFGNVWDDVRTLLLLVVLLFLATSVTFDAVVVFDRRRGVLVLDQRGEAACFLLGLLLAVAVTEGLLRGIRLALPALFRVPYYLILGLFFLYPLGLRLLPSWPPTEGAMWGLFGFATVAGLVFLTLLPAVRRGPAYVQGNGSPWPWPQYPWALFVLLAGAVPARAFLLCWSMYLPGRAHSDLVIFGPYFLVPFGFALTVLVLEMGLVSGRARVHTAALLAPVGLLLLALVGHRNEPIYTEFLDHFRRRLGGDPLYLTLLASACFYAYAALRRVPVAAEALTAALVALAVVGPDTLKLGGPVAPGPVPVLAAAVLQLGLGLWRGSSWRCLLGAGGLVPATVLVLPGDGSDWVLRAVVAFHLALLAVLVVGAAFDDALGRGLRVLGPALVPLACLAVLFGLFRGASGLSWWLLWAYPLLMAALLAGYGVLLPHRTSRLLAGLVLGCWLVVICWQGYPALRQLVRGLDYLVMSFGLFGLALLISLAKSGILARRLALPAGRAGDSEDDGLSGSAVVGPG